MILNIFVSLDEEEQANDIHGALGKIVELSLAIKRDDDDRLRRLIPFIHQFLDKHGKINGEKNHIVGIQRLDGQKIIIGEKPEEIYYEKQKQAVQEVMLSEQSLPDVVRFVIDTASDAIDDNDGQLEGESYVTNENFTLTRKNIEAAVGILNRNRMDCQIRPQAERRPYEFEFLPVNKISLPIESR